MKLSALIILCPVIAFGGPLGDTGPIVLELKQAELRTVLHQYENYSGRRVEIVEGVDAPAMDIKFKGEREKLIKEIESELKKENIALYPITPGRFIATWINPPDGLNGGARSYLLRCKQKNITPPVEKIGWSELARYSDRHPELQQARDESDRCNEIVKEMLEKDPEYRAANEEYENYKGSDAVKAKRKRDDTISSIRSRMATDDGSFRNALTQAGKARFKANIMALEIIINDYDKQRRKLPTDWMELE